MLSETLSTALEGYAIGPKIRRLRLRKKLGLVQLGEHIVSRRRCGRKLKRACLERASRTLWSSASGSVHFLERNDGRSVVRQAERRPRRRPGKASSAYRFALLDYPVSDRKLNGYYVEFAVEAEQSEPHEHPGAEIVYVLGGELVVNLEGEDFTLGQGD